MESETGQEGMSIKCALVSGYWNSSCWVERTPQNPLPEGGWAFTYWFPTTITEGCSWGHSLFCLSKLSCAWAEQTLVASENAIIRQKSGGTGVWELTGVHG